MSEMNEKNVTMNEEMAKNEEQQNAPAENENKEKKHPVKDFFKKNGKKIGIGLGVGLLEVDGILEILDRGRVVVVGCVEFVEEVGRLVNANQKGVLRFDRTDACNIFIRARTKEETCRKHKEQE